MYVALGTALVYGVAIGSRTLLVTAGTVLVLLALPQRYLCARSEDRRSQSPDPISRNRT
ncbi:hypothetical protein [Natronorubrum halalkaliphilum]|uniref:hypothetical protein n=1 Tax=Natronorubrum halalkaliphilum TaxID=2691917 RepID=UPI0019160D4F|nr:hypothetical protein [Natronorubrum halalkaliphilum]